MTNIDLIKKIKLYRLSPLKRFMCISIELLENSNCDIKNFFITKYGNKYDTMETLVNNILMSEFNDFRVDIYKYFKV